MSAGGFVRKKCVNFPELFLECFMHNQHNADSADSVRISSA